MKFSQRQGFNEQKLMQIDSVDLELKEGLWNVYYHIFFKQIPSTGVQAYLVRKQHKLGQYFDSLWDQFFKRRIDMVPEHVSICRDQIREDYDYFEWFEIYDFIEFNLKILDTIELTTYKEPYAVFLNDVLERENSGFRIVKDLVVPIINSIEIDAITSAMSNNPFENARIHLSKSLEKLSNKVNPDYRNSIKESISAVESICREITKESTLGQALKKLESSGLEIHQQLKSAFEKLYSYTNDKEVGIRHSLLETPNPPSFADAKYFLVVCSAFVNYLIQKQVSGSIN